MLRAITRSVSPSIGSCALTHLERTPIDAGRAAAQHSAYEQALVDAGCSLLRAVPAPEFPDGVFVEDTAVVVGRRAILTRPGAPSRRPEVDSVAELLAGAMPTARIDRPGTLDGGDVLRIAGTLYVGRTARSNDEGIRQLAAHVAPDGIEVIGVDLGDALHLKTAVTALDPETVLVQPRWLDPAVFDGLRIVEVDPAEPFAANTLRIGDVLIVPAAHPRTAGRCAGLVPEIRLVEVDELAKAEGGVTCCSILFDTEA